MTCQQQADLIVAALRCTCLEGFIQRLQEAVNDSHGQILRDTASMLHVIITETVPLPMFRERGGVAVQTLVCNGYIALAEHLTILLAQECCRRTAYS